MVIPFKDRWDMTRLCIDGLLQQKLDRCELIVALINNNSSLEYTVKEFNKLSVLNPSVKLYKFSESGEFSYSRINNTAVERVGKKESVIDFIWFLNNDISFTTNTTLGEYVDFASTTKNFGALGSTLLYPDNKYIQHLFLSPGTKLAGAHPLKGAVFCKDHKWFIHQGLLLL